MRLTRFGKRKEQPGGQSFVELALILPLILIMFIGMIEVGFYVFNYLNALDLTREAARFASNRDPTNATPGAMEKQLWCTSPTPGVTPTPQYCECLDSSLDYYKDTACFFVDDTLNASTIITETKYDDVTISVFSILSDGTVIRRRPDVDDTGIDPNNDGVWSLFDDNWRKDCQGNIVRNDPYFTNEDISALFGNPTKEKGVVLVEAHVCYDQMIYIPLISEFIGSPFRIHTYTFMPAPEAIPTPTPIP